MGFPQQGRSPADILAELKARKGHDVPWAEGRVFAYVYDAGPVAMRLLKDATALYLGENGLDPTAFPSMLRMENDIIGWAIDLMNGGPKARGTFTSGGTESILLSVKTARDLNRATRPHIAAPTMVLPETAHPAFFKACAYFDVRPVTVPVDPLTFRAVPDAMRDAVGPDTIMIVGSAPSYGHGIIDPIEELGRIALEKGVLFHVDCCVGGMYLPFARKLGHDVPAFDLGVPGVTQLSMDFHKWGYAGKGASCILYADGDMRRHQIFAWSGWAGYTVVNPTVLSSKSGGPMAACWAIVSHLGMDGYLKLVGATQAASEKIRAGIRGIEGLRLNGDPKLNLFSFTSDSIDLFALAEDMKERGWFIQPQFGFSNSPVNIHLSVGASNAPHAEAMLRDLAEATAIRREKDARRGSAGMPAEFAALLAAPGPEVIDRLGEALGVADGALPERMDAINNILNALPAESRDRLLVEYVNRLYAPA